VFRLILIALLVCSTHSANASAVRLESTSVEFIAPKGFTELSLEEIQAKFPSRTGPDSAVGNERRTTTIAYGIRDVAVTDAILEEQLKQISTASSRAVPGFSLIEQGMRTINDRNWAYMEFRSTAMDTDIRNILLMSAYKGRMIVINFNSAESDFKELEPQLRESIASLGSPE
jgi:hypothetical protein